MLEEPGESEEEFNEGSEAISYAPELMQRGGLDLGQIDPLSGFKFIRGQGEIENPGMLPNAGQLPKATVSAGFD